MRNLDEYMQHIRGNEVAFALEHRIFNMSSFLITSFAVLGATANYLIGLHMLTVWLSLAGALISGALYYYSRFRNHFSISLIVIYIIATMTILSWMNFYNGGLEGNVIYLIIMLQNIFLLIAPAKYQYWIYSLFYLNILALLLLEYIFPHWVLPYSSREEKIIDHAVTMLYTLLYTTVVIAAYRKSYYTERERVAAQNRELLSLNEQITWQRQKLEDKTQELEAAVKIANDRHEHINTLLRELNHRVKNNLQVISSLLNLQAFAVQDENARHAILESKNRLLSMILVHQRLYQVGSATDVYMMDYLRELAETIMFSYNGIFEDEMLEYDIEPVWLNIEATIPLGLICNELISNAFKHAFKDTPEPRLKVTFKDKGAQYLLEIEDNGSGIRHSASSKTFGMDLVNSMVKQLNGNLSITVARGTSVSVLFSLGKNKQGASENRSVDNLSLPVYFPDRLEYSENFSEKTGRNG
ncbi:sensor histidine kinase [Pontibacter sp. SGAir0037]|uniref:sensor histidine kinase n=1 Tax=Pontibacter sp. SGAir0037 TaxID=2571030 RepID=UPI0010CD0ED4|nr:sensor histidine kinase [Pontibacter sp. SGAir0037]QCR24363.1 hypothetical protein C1N53_19685 [Pontibacter sp. SGAir0037]